jgi:lauroyl/myristoyl acyltransferase
MFYAWLISLAVSIFYDRLTSPRWQKRMPFTGNISLMTEGKQPVIIVFLHTGGYPVLRYWLRAKSLPAALYLTMNVRLSRFTQEIWARADLAYGLQDVPHLFFRKGSLRKAVEFLKPGRVLLIALEERNFSATRKAYPFGEGHICLNDLAVRMALLTNAVLLPVTVKLKGFCRFQIDFKEPVPSALLNEGVDSVNLYLARQFWPDVVENPLSMTWATLEAIAPDAIGPRGLTP